jgi:hypothetical protein
LLDQEAEFWLGLGIARQQQLPPIGCRQVDIDHLDRGEFLQSAACGQPGRQGMQAKLERDLQTVGEECDEDMSFYSVLVLMEDRTYRQILLQVFESLSGYIPRSLLRSYYGA